MYVSVSVTSRCYIETARRIELVFAKVFFDLRYTEIRVSLKIRLLLFGITSQTLDYKIFTTARRSSQRFVNLVRQK